MTLAADEFRAHLELSAATARMSLPEIVLPEEHHVLLRRMRFHYLDWGTAGPAADRVPPRRRAQRPHVGSRLPRAAARAALRGARPARARRERVVAADGLLDREPRRRPRRVRRVAWAHAVRARRHVARRRQRARVGGPAQRPPRRARRRRRGPGDPHRGREEDRRVHVGVDAARLRRRVHRARDGVQPAAQPRALAPEPAPQPAAHAGRPLHVEVRPAAPRQGRSRTPTRAGASSCGRRSSASSARRWSCAARRATCSTTRTPRAWPTGSAAAAGSRSRAPGTPCRATTPRACSSSCARSSRR